MPRLVHRAPSSFLNSKRGCLVRLVHLHHRRPTHRAHHDSVTFPTVWLRPDEVERACGMHRRPATVLQTHVGVIDVLNDSMQRGIWIGGISLANATAAGIVLFWVLHDAAGAGWAVIVPSAVLATLGLTVGGLWWSARRRPSRWTGIGIGVLVGVFVHPLTWYLALLLAFFHGDRGTLGDPTLTPWESLAGVWVYSFFSFLLAGWLSCPISAAICWTGLALYLRRLESPLTQTAILCSSCGADWSRGMFRQHCRECGGGALEHACLVCGGRCGQPWQRVVIDSRDEHEAYWIGACAHSAHHGS
jgi:hypothetical protein